MALEQKAGAMSQDAEPRLVEPTTAQKTSTTEEALDAQFRLMNSLDLLNSVVQTLSQADACKTAENCIADIAVLFEQLLAFKTLKHMQQLQTRFRTLLSSPAYCAFVTKFLERENEGVNAAVAEAQKQNAAEPLLLFIRSSIKRVAVVSTGELFFHAFQAWKAGLQMYCQSMAAMSARTFDAALATPTTPGVATVSSSLSLDFQEIKDLFQRKAAPPIARLSVEGATWAADSVVRAQEMMEHLRQLEGAVKSKLLPYWRPNVSLEQPVEQCQVLINKTIASLASALLADANALIQYNLTNMGRKADKRSSRNAHDASSSTSTSTFTSTTVDWVTQAVQLIHPHMARFAKSVSASSYAHLCNCTLPVLATHLADWLLSPPTHKPFADTELERLSADARKLKSGLLSLYSLGAVSAATHVHVKVFHSSFRKVDNVVMLLCCPAEAMIVLFKTLLPTSSPSELVNSMTLRGLKAAEQRGLVLEYNASVAAESAIPLAVLPEVGALDRLWQGINAR